MSSSRARLLIGAALVGLTGIGLWGYGAFTKPPPPPPAPAIPVVAQPARQGDVPVYFTGIGTVQAYNTVTVRFQVTGVLTRVAFVEGQDVKAGDLLAQIDPRPFQAQLDQVVAAKARDEAILANAKLDLARYQRLVNPCAGNLTFLQAAVAAGWAPGDCYGSDISLYTSALGYLAAGRKLSELGVAVSGPCACLEPHLQGDDAQHVAAILLALWIGTHFDKDPYTAQAAKHVLRQSEVYLSSLAGLGCGNAFRPQAMLHGNGPREAPHPSFAQLVARVALPLVQKDA